MKYSFLLFLYFFFCKDSVTNACGGNLLANRGELLLTSPNYPQNHAHNLNCTWTITSISQVNVLLTITDLDTESCCDYLEIFDGDIMIAHLNGRPAENIPFITSSSTLILRFVSDGSVSNTGFRATFLEVSNCGTPLVVANYPEYFSTPFYPEEHPPNLDCFWMISSPDETKQVEVVFTEGRTNSCCDYIDVYDWPNFLDRIKGNISEKLRYSSTANRLGIYFHSVAETTRDGFLASYKEYECGGWFTLSGNSQGEFSSPNYPVSAAHNLDCRYNITAEPGYRIELTLEVDTEECCDYLSLYEGEKFLGTLNGSIPKSTVISVGRNLYIHFHTDGSTHSKGFKGKYRQIPSSCGKEETASESYQEIISPGFPHAYPNNYHCNWLITAPAGMQIVFKVQELSTERCCDYLEVFDGIQSIGQLRGTIPKPVTIVSYGSSLFVRFYSDDTTTGNGFSASYKLADNCGSVKYALPRLIQDFYIPGRPDVYPDELDCMWIIQSNDFTNVQLNVSFGQTENADNFIEVLDNLELLKSVHKFSQTSHLYLSKSNTLRVYFHSKQRANRIGFRASFQEVCDYTFNVTETGAQFLSSPNYPNYTPHLYNCSYKLKPAIGRRIALNVVNFQTELCCDYAEIFDGERLSYTLRGNYNQNHPIFLSSNNTIRIQYVTDSSVSSVGFLMTYQLL